jgi:hypothetical protein
MRVINPACLIWAFTPFDTFCDIIVLQVTNKFQPQQVWLDAQRMPHNDIKWHYGVDRQTDEVAGSFASVRAPHTALHHISSHCISSRAYQCASLV